MNNGTNESLPTFSFFFFRYINFFFFNKFWEWKEISIQDQIK